MTDYYPPQTEGSPAAPLPDKASGMAITAFVLGLLGTCCCFSVLGGIPALIFGFLEKKKIERGESSQRSFGFAMAGIILGIISFVQLIIMIIYYVIVFLVIMGGKGNPFGGMKPFS